MRIKQCIRCREVKPTEEFYSIQKGDGYSSKCKKCSCYYQLDYAINNADKIKSYNKEYRKTHKKKQKEPRPIPNGFIPIQDYPNYFVSKDSQQIWSRKTGKLLKSTKVNHGYLATTIGNEDGRKMVLVHRILAEAFVPNPNNLPCVNHEDGNKLNNDVSNLSWVSYQENIQHAIRLGLFRKKKGYKKNVITREQAIEIIKNPDNLTQQQLADRYGLAKGTISGIHQGRHWRTIDRNEI